MPHLDWKKRSWNQKILLYAFCGSVVGGVLIGVLTERPLAGLIVFGVCFLVFFLFLAAIWAVTVIHEGGHVLAGLAMGYKFHLVQIGSLSLVKSSSGLRVAKSRFQWEGGLTIMAPPVGKPNIWKHRLYIAGGPAANILCAIAFLVLFRLFSPPPGAPSREHGLDYLLAAGILFSGVSALISLVPKTSQRMGSDGMHLWLIRRNDAATLRQLAIQFVGYRVYIGELARHWPLEWMEAMREPPDGTLQEVSSHYLRFYWHADLGENELAWNELLRASAVCTQLKEKAGIYSILTHSAQVFAAAWLFRDRDLLQTVPELKPPTEELCQADYYRALAAVALLNDRPEESLFLVRQARELLQKLCEQLNTHSANDSLWLDQLEAEAAAFVGD